MCKRYSKGDWTNCRYDVCEIIDVDDEIICTVALRDVDMIIDVLNENEQLKKQRDELIKSIQDTVKLSADAICKPMQNKVWGKGE